jgi:hypothetical protein
VGDVSVHVREAEVTAGPAVGQSFVIQAQQVENRGVEVMHMHPIFGRLHSQFIGGSVDHPAFDPATGEEHRKAGRMMIAPNLPGTLLVRLGEWGTSKFSAPYHEGIVEQATRFQIADQGTGRSVAVGAQFRMPLMMRAVRVPRLIAAISGVVDAHKSHAVFDESSGEQAGIPEPARAVHLADMRGFLRYVEGFSCLCLHLVGGFHRLDLRLQFGVAIALTEVQVIQFLEQVQLSTLLREAEVRVSNVGEELLHRHVVRDDARRRMGCRFPVCILSKPGS